MSRIAPIILTDQQAERVIRLWRTQQFDTVEIAEFVAAPEPAVCRLIQAARDVIREFSRAG
jgi:hypothetical protein